MAVTRRPYSWDFRGSDISCSNILREGKPMTKFFKISLCICGFALLFSVCSMAQMQNGQFTGTVTDPSGAAVPSAKVTITNQATNLSVSTTTNSTGFYTAKELPVGTYKLMVEAPGFKTFTDVGVVLNARNVYDLMTIAPGAVSVAGTDFENGHGTVVNGVRENFNGFLINGVSNKQLSGGNGNTPIQDTVEEFQQLDLNMSAQYGNSAGSNVNLVTKSGTNSIHGSVWEYLRNDYFDANDYFLNQQGAPRPPLHWNQFGFTLGGPIVKDKLFYFLSYQGSRFKTVGAPNPITLESPEWRNAVHQADLGVSSGIPATSAADFLYGGFLPNVSQSTPAFTLDQYIGSANTVLDYGFSTYVDYLCPDSYGPNGLGGAPTLNQATAIAARMQSILGVLPSDNFGSIPILGGAPCSVTPGQQPGTVSRTAAGSSLPFEVNSVSLFKSQTGSGGNSNLFNGNEYSGRIDYNWNASNRLSGAFNWSRATDQTGGCGPSCTRGFHNPTITREPNGNFSYVHTFSPAVLNEFRAGYLQNVILTNTAFGGVPSVGFDDGSVGFGSYNGYPQFFKENIY